MNKSLRVLHLEDSARDAELIRSTLEAANLDCQIMLVASEKEFSAALNDGRYDVILSDYGLVDYDGLSALALAQRTHSEIPFILISGTLGEEEAVESLKTGATDYILKSRLTRLAPAVQRAIEDARKRAELKEAETRLLRAQRLESIGALASGIAHDLNNILAPIMMSAPMLRWGLKPEQVEKTLVSIEKSAQRGADLVKQLLLFGRGVEGNKAVLQPKHLIRDIVRMVRETFPKAISVESQTDGDLWTVFADSTQIHQVLLNLCVNARDAMPNGGKLSLSANNVVITEGDRKLAELNSGPFVRLRVTDTGEGIPQNIIDKIFDPFFTTKEPGRGTGLGLSTVIGIVKSHGGHLDVQSTVGRGTTFTIHFPATPLEHAPAPETSSMETVNRGGGELLLIVDDEPEILKATGQNLERHGYRTLLAHDGVDALVLFTQRQDEIYAIVTDLDMPSMDGVTLARAIKRLNSNSRIIVSTGIGSGQGLEAKTLALNDLGVRTLLTKPYGVEVLLRAVQEDSRKP